MTTEIQRHGQELRRLRAEHDPLRSPIHLPQRMVGGYRIQHGKGTTFDVVSVREAILTGQKPQKVTFPEPVTIHQLFGRDGGLWVADVPTEIRQHREAVARMMPHGKVLVGGLGLGIAAALLAQDPHVESVDVVEISPEIAELCDPHNPKVTLHVTDLQSFLRKQDYWPWSGAFIDLWRATSEDTWWGQVLPLRRLIGAKFGLVHAASVLYWAEDIMLGQVGHRLLNATEPHWYYRKCLNLPMTKNQARWFIHQAGTPRWEKKYGACYPNNPVTEEDK